MYKQSFGTNGQIQFANEHEYYKFLGFLARSDGSTSIVWEHNKYTEKLYRMELGHSICRQALGKSGAE